MVNCMNDTLVKCLREGCNNIRNEIVPLGLCYPCRVYMIDAARMIRKSTKKATHKAKADMVRYKYSVCSVKSCKKRSFMRNRCRKHYIEFMSQISNK